MLVCKPQHLLIFSVFGIYVQLYVPAFLLVCFLFLRKESKYSELKFSKSLYCLNL